MLLFLLLLLLLLLFICKSNNILLSSLATDVSLCFCFWFCYDLSCIIWFCTAMCQRVGHLMTNGMSLIFLEFSNNNYSMAVWIIAIIVVKNKKKKIFKIFHFHFNFFYSGNQSLNFKVKSVLIRLHGLCELIEIASCFGNSWCEGQISVE